MRGNSKEDEKELIKKIQSGDMNAFTKIFEIHKDQALKYSYLITGNKFTLSVLKNENYKQSNLLSNEDSKKENLKECSA